MLQFLSHNSLFRLPVLPSLLLIMLLSEAVVGVFCKKDVLANFAKFTSKHHKGIPVQIFSCEFCEISPNTFFKEPLGRLLLHKHSLCLMSYHDLSPFQRRCHTNFLAQYFFGLICRLGTTVISIFQTLSTKPIFNQVKHLGCSFS